MGYSEVLCNICGVSFNIGRIRTPNEPRSAAWSRFGPVPSKFHVVDGADSRYIPYYSCVDGGRNSWIGECSRDAGCKFTFRKIKDEGAGVVISGRGRRRLIPKDEIIEEDDEEDGDWEPRAEDDDDDDEPLEYASDLEDDIPGETDDVEMEDAEDADRTLAVREEYRRFCIRALVARSETQLEFEQNNPEHPAWYRGNFVVEKIDEIEDDMFPLFYPGKDDETEYGTEGSASEDSASSLASGRLDHYIGGKLGYYPKQQYDVEHIAGPGCLNRAGYSGHEISVEEMRGCQVSQCLMRKSGNFEPLEDDEDFERKGAFCLSGLSDHMPSRDMNVPQVKPPRHGCERPHAENTVWDESVMEEYAMPFHPWCFEVFKRTSMLEYGTIDVGGLTSWWTEEARNNRVFEGRLSTDVSQCTEQEWGHWKGTEYLAANPLYVPRLRDILQRVVSTAPGFSPRNSAFTISQKTTPGTSNDLFARLPAELQFEVLDGLRSKDIASLRLASRAFRQLPISYFQKLLNREMPWFWEAQPTPTKPDQLPYSFWATVTAGEAEIKLRETQNAIDSLNDYVRIVSAEMPELKHVLEEALPAEIQAVLDEEQLKGEDQKPFFLPPDRTDYYLLYVLIKRHWKELRGLQNRKRIWKECKDIGLRIKRMRKKGKIGPLVQQS
ncbi:hypothetical protein P171DRAFT_427261 [Karstenula rhodostoma CBS 690.94]|uniref:F-box domain-containing protein n=1 Tax=Karstenula rhodostoma CBS 690.94 TaxID=1392251 RepID=A0A9P4PXB1_9PLEO|nr:hypothetical protein P171DRAFT_427261 [Karstenula rhodostoma CBS 690.94]